MPLSCSLLVLCILLTGRLAGYVDTYADLDISKPRVYVVYTGGTIGMRKTPNGYSPAPGYLSDVVRHIPNFQSPDMPDFTIKEYAPLLDSSNMAPSDWRTVALDIYDNYHKYDGFVVIHGTDTMAYTSSALSFLLQNTAKTVIVTGSQIPLAETINDGVFNLVGAIKLAGTLGIPEVGVYFYHHLFRGNRVSKVSAWSLGGFDSGHLRPLATFAVTIALEDSLILPFPTATLAKPGKVSNDVVMIHLFPGITGDFVRNALKSAQGCVLLAFGTGNGPDANKDFLAALKEAHARGVVIVDATQCHQGIVNLYEYAAGNAFLDVGAISGYDMTPEAAFTKLAWLMGQEMGQREVEVWMGRDIAGEVSVPKTKAGEGHA